MSPPFYDRRHGDVCLVQAKSGQTAARAAVFGSEDIAPVQGTHLRLLFDAESGTLFKHGGDSVLDWQDRQEEKGTPFELARVDIPLGLVTPEVLEVVNRVLVTSHCGHDLLARLSALAAPEASTPSLG